MSDHHKKNKNIISNKKAFSSIVGAIFAILVIISMTGTFVVWSFNQNTRYSQSLSEISQLDLVQQTESINVTSRPIYTMGDGTVTVHVDIQNDGPISVNITTLWVQQVESNAYGYLENAQLRIPTLSPGDTYTINNVVIPLLGSPNGNVFYGWLITGRGSIIHLFPNHETGPAGKDGDEFAQTALVSQGIGSVAMDFDLFRTYDFGTSQPPNGTLLSYGTESRAYTISNNHYYAIRVALINMDSSVQSISLKSSSYIWGLTPQSGTLKSCSWNILRMGLDNKLYTGNSFSVDLPFNVTKYVYFGISPAGFSNAAFPIVIPINILLYGNNVFANGTKSEYGQNLPFISLNIPG